MSYCGALVTISLLILPFLYDINTKFRYYIKFTLYYFILIIYSIILIPFVLLHPFDRSNIL